MKMKKVLHILRNPWGWSSVEIREAQIEACNLIEKNTRAEPVSVNAECSKAIANMRLKFTSGNDIPIERAVITADEWRAISRCLASEPVRVEDFEEYTRKRFHNIVNGAGAVIPRIAVKIALDDIFSNDWLPIPPAPKEG